VVTDRSEEAEFHFELRVCRWAEQDWHPTGGQRPVIVARQFGTRRRRWDTIVIEVDPEGLRQRRQFGDRAFDSDLLHVLRHAPAEFTYYRDALPHPGYPWRYVRESIHEAADRDAIETRREGNRIQIRRVRPYPDWVERVIAIENKPDLDARAARVLRPQIEHDVALGLADEVWIATRSTGERVEPALLEDVPVEAGVLILSPHAERVNGERVDGEGADSDSRAEVAWRPRTLATDESGTRILERPDGGAADASAARFEYVDPEEKQTRRLAIAERAFERGWRSYHDHMRTDCRSFELRRSGDVVLPWCDAKDCHQTPTACSGACSEFAPEPPAWRSGGWPIEGGPGKAVETIFERRKRRYRPE
jgi:hypothetical protein